MGGDLHADDTKQNENEDFTGKVMSTKPSLVTIPLLPEFFP